jgi:hypothetical protein
MDYVYICRSGENEELRYSIRSLVANLPDVNVWLIGSAPSWYTGKLIRNNAKRLKYALVRENLRMISEEPQINENFIFMNDDFFVMKPLDAIEIWCGGSLLDRYNRRVHEEGYTDYTKYLWDTYNTIKHSGVENPVDYELHTPLPMTKASLSEALDKPGLWRSITANKNSIGGEQHEDVKIYHPSQRLYNKRNLEDSLYLSCDDISFDVLHSQWLKDRFPEPSRYERSSKP